MFTVSDTAEHNISSGPF